MIKFIIIKNYAMLSPFLCVYFHIKIYTMLTTFLCLYDVFIMIILKILKTIINKTFKQNVCPYREHKMCHFETLRFPYH